MKNAIFLTLWGVTVATIMYFALRPDYRGDCLRFTRELKILTACDKSNSCIFSPKDLKRMDALQTSCQELAQ